MRFKQLTEVLNIQELETQSLVSRYKHLSSTEHTTASIHDAVHQLKQQLLTLDDVSYQGIDLLMREISQVHEVHVHDLHDAFVRAEGVTPDEWIHAHKSAT
jgi:DNA repair ATPase RecN